MVVVIGLNKETINENDKFSNLMAIYNGQTNDDILKITDRTTNNNIK